MKPINIGQLVVEVKTGNVVGRMVSFDPFDGKWIVRRPNGAFSRYFFEEIEGLEPEDKTIRAVSTPGIPLRRPRFHVGDEVVFFDSDRESVGKVMEVSRKGETLRYEISVPDLASTIRFYRDEEELRAHQTPTAKFSVNDRVSFLFDGGVAYGVVHGYERSGQWWLYDVYCEEVLGQPTMRIAELHLTKAGVAHKPTAKELYQKVSQGWSVEVTQSKPDTFAAVAFLDTTSNHLFVGNGKAHWNKKDAGDPVWDWNEEKGKRIAIHKAKKDLLKQVEAYYQ